MALPVRCPSCQAKFKAPDHTAGKRVSCPKCGTPFVVQAAAATDTESPAAPVPPPLPPARDDATADEAPAFPFAGGTTAPESLTDPEPWFYGFIAGYARFYLYLGMAVALLVGGSFIITSGAATYAALSKDSHAGAGVAVVLALVTVGYVVGLVFVLLGLVFGVALILLLVDMGRNLRRIKANTRP